MPLPGESPMQPPAPGGIGAPGPPQQPQQGQGPGQPQKLPGQSPVPQPADPYKGMIGVLSRQIMRANARLDAERQSLSDSEKASFAGRQAELTPIRQKITGAADALIQGLGAPEPPKLPAWEPGPVVNSEDFQKFGFMALAIGLIGGIASKGDWMGATASLNGAVKGFYDGSVMVAKKNWEDFQEKYQEARDDYEMKLSHYRDITNDRNLSINAMFTQYQLAADRYNDDLMKFSLQQKDLDSAQKHIDTLERMLWQAELAHAKVNAQVGGIMAGADMGSIAMAAAGVPLTRIWPGLSTAMSNFRTQKQREVIDYIAQQKGITEEAAGVELAKRQAQYTAGGRSVTQQMLMLGATDSLTHNLEFQLRMASQEIDRLGTKVNDLSPIFNAIIRGEERIAGRPELTRLLYYMNYAMNESARISSGGAASAAQLHEGAAERAQDMMSMGMTTPKMFKEGVVPALMMEAQNRRQNFIDEIATQEQRMTAQPVNEPVYVPPPGVPADPLMRGGAGAPPQLSPDQMDDQLYGQP